MGSQTALLGEAAISSKTESFDSDVDVCITRGALQRSEMDTWTSRKQNCSHAAVVSRDDLRICGLLLLPLNCGCPLWSERR